MPRVHSFEPVVGRDPRIIILGSMPGIISLQAVEYYAHPRNLFWTILAELFEIDIACSYQQRVRQVQELPLILWDTLKSCHREGSLDANISNQQIEANDIVGLVEQHPRLRAIACNGASSHKYFKRLVEPHLPAAREIEVIKLPSTSPANAGMSWAQKLAAWRCLKDFV